MNKQALDRMLGALEDRQWRHVWELKEWEVRLAEYVKPGVYTFRGESEKGAPSRFLTGAAGTTYFLSSKVDIPAECGGDPVGLIVEFGGEGLLRVNGKPYHGLDSNHTFVPLLPEKVGDRPLLEMELFDPIPEPEDPLNKQAVIRKPIASIRTLLVAVNRPLQSFLRSLTAAKDTLLRLPERDPLAGSLRRAIDEAMNRVERRGWEPEPDDAFWREAELALLEKARAIAPDRKPYGRMRMIGQSHIDVAWLWPIRETVRKTSRTFSTVCTLMDEYPAFLYSQSQPQLYAYAKEHYPELYERIKERIAEGRWELVGGMWVEPDLNLPSGESLMRQLLHGQRFYMQEFGKRTTVEWLPDTFGYCASLPQILQHAGIRYFMTSKLGWNDTNLFPHDLFHWKGIDGTKVLTFLNHGLNEHTKAADIQEHWDSYRQKDRHPDQMLLYGHGDGGGGVTREMIEYVQRADLMPGLPQAEFGTAIRFFEGVGEAREDLPEWRGDLYLELHRGTFTTHARNKRWNRKAELLYRDAEVWSELGRSHAEAGSREAFNSAMEEGWKLLLLNQFHDIIPGSSITEVYDTSAKEYERIFEIGDGSLKQGIDAIVGAIAAEGEGVPYHVFNSLGWMRDEVAAIEGGAELRGMAAFDRDGNALSCDLLPGTDEKDGACVLAVRVPEIPAFGYATVWLKPVREAASTPARSVELALAGEDNRWETEFYVLEFDRTGAIVRWYDKAENREWLAPGSRGNELLLFHDKPTLWDAWDIDPNYENNPSGAAELVSAQAVIRGETLDLLRFEWKIGRSSVYQDVVLYRHDKRVDFRTRVRWEESHKLLKASFGFDLTADKAAYEIPFGAIERPTHRNTSWEQAQYEVCGHRWADVSEGGCGIALLNDCKYGYDIREGRMRLSLLRAPKWPDSTADQGWHEFVYSVYPHGGGRREAQVARKAAELNSPALVRPGVSIARKVAGALPDRHSFLRLKSEHVVLDTIKASEDGDDTILRLYESSGGRERIFVGWPEPLSRVVAVNALELEDEDAEELSLRGGGFELSFRPYEIKTIKLIR